MKCRTCGNQMKREVIELRTGVGDYVVVSRDRRVDYCEACKDYEMGIRDSQELSLKAAIVVLRDQGVRHTPDLFKHVRKILGMTQAELAKKLDVRQETVSRWEKEQDAIQVCTWGALAELVCEAHDSLTCALSDFSIESPSRRTG